MIARRPSASRSIRSARPWTVTPASAVSPLISALSGRRPSALIGALLADNPVDRLEQSRRPQRAQHRVDRAIPQQHLGAGAQAVGIAIVMLQPLLEHLVDRLALPRGILLGIDRIERPQLQDRLA